MNDQILAAANALADHLRGKPWMGHVGIGGEEDNDSLILFTAQHSKEANAIKEWQGYPVEVIVVGRAKPALV